MYKLENGEKWPENRFLNYNTILQLDLYCHKMEKWNEIPYVQAFMVLTNISPYMGLIIQTLGNVLA